MRQSVVSTEAERSEAKRRDLACSRARPLHSASLRSGRRFVVIPELGQYALILALAVALVQGTLPLIGAARGDVGLIAVGRPAALAQLAFVVILRSAR